MQVGTKVKNIDTGNLGHVIVDSFRCCSDTEELVVYDGTSIGLGTDKEILEEVSGSHHIPDLEKCGAGKGKECCIFPTVGPDGIVCERFTSMRDTLIFRSMNAERNPEEPYPQCMKF